MAKITRGVRLNNPGNLDRGSKWVGLAADQPDTRFAKFTEPKYGIRALAKVLLTYYKKYNLKTIGQIISRYAPPNENDTQRYIQDVAMWTGFEINKQLDLTNKEIMLVLIKAIIRKEQGGNPYPDELLKEGVKLAL